LKIEIDLDDVALVLNPPKSFGDQAHLLYQGRLFAQLTSYPAWLDQRGTSLGPFFQSVCDQIKAAKEAE